MFVTKCVIGILGAISGTYPSLTLSLFQFNPETKKHEIIASVAAKDKSQRFSNIILSGTFSESGYVMNPDTIDGGGNLYGICPKKVTKMNCANAYGAGTELYTTCLNYVKENKGVILFPSKRTVRRNLMTSYHEAAQRNKRKRNVFCLKILKKQKNALLSKKPAMCTNFIIRDLIYGAEVNLKGKFDCKREHTESSTYLNPDIPLDMRLDAPHEVHHDSYGDFLFTTDGTHILRLVSKSLNEKENYWFAEREIERRGTGDISFIIKRTTPKSVLRKTILRGKKIKVKFDKCPVDVPLNKLVRPVS